VYIDINEDIKHLKKKLKKGSGEKTKIRNIILKYNGKTLTDNQIIKKIPKLIKKTTVEGYNITHINNIIADYSAATRKKYKKTKNKKKRTRRK